MPLSSEPCDAIGELVGIGVAQSLQSWYNLGIPTVTPAAPQVMQGSPEQVGALLQEGCAPLDKLIMLEFGGGQAGRAVLALSKESSTRLTTMLCHRAHLTNPSEADQDDLLQEVANLLLNGLIGSLANTLSVSVVAPVPQVISDLSLPMLLAQHWSVAKNSDEGVFLAAVPFQTEAQDIGGAVIVLFDPATILRLLVPATPAGATEA